MPTYFTPFSTRKLIIGLSLQGWKYKQISQVTGVSKTKIYKISQHFKSTGNIFHEKELAGPAKEKYTMPKSIPFSMRKEVIGLFLGGCKQAEISRTTGVHRSSVQRIIHQFRSTGQIARSPEKHPMGSANIPFLMRKEVISSFLQGFNASQIFQITGVRRRTVRKIVRRFESTGEIASTRQRLKIRKPLGRPPKVSHLGCASLVCLAFLGEGVLSIPDWHSMSLDISIVENAWKV